jgi:hypothetical protein
MRVKLCSRCPYTPRDLADHYDPAAALYACARCDGATGILTASNSCEVQRRQPCVTSFHSINMTQPSAAPSAKDGLASFAITHGEPRCAPKNASIASRPAGTPTAHGCADFAPPEARLREATEMSAARNREPLR